MKTSSARCSTSVGTVIDGSTARTSISEFIRISFAAVPGLAERRSSRANHSRRRGFSIRRRGQPDYPRAVAPVVEPAVVEERKPLLATGRPVVVRGPRHPRHRLVQDERGRALGVRGREQGRHRAALELRVHGRALRAGGVQHRDHVVHLLLERRRLGDRIGQPRSATVEHDQPRERREAVEVPRHPRLIPVVLDLRDPGGHVHDVDRAVADDLVGDVEIAAARVSRVG